MAFIPSSAVHSLNFCSLVNNETDNQMNKLCGSNDQLVCPASSQEERQQQLLTRGKN